VLEQRMAEEADKNAADAAKNVALNAGGGGSQGSKIVSDPDVVDQLISNRSNPNIL
jgi:hypothetical protein